MNTQDELKNCPFCGGRAEEVITGKGTANPKHRIRCTVCGCQTPATVASPSHVETWNRREEWTCHDETKYRDFFTCSVCHESTGRWAPNYCPVCGAKVVEE